MESRTPSSNHAIAPEPSRPVALIVAQYAALLFFLFELIATLMRTALNSPGADFHVYVHAGEQFRRQLNPYPHPDFPLGYIYPPMTLPLAALLSRIDGPAAQLWIVTADSIALLIAIYLWDKYFLPSRAAGILLLAAALFAYKAAVFELFSTGNIGLLEICILSCGLAAVIAGRVPLGCVLIALVALVKPPDIALLAIPFFYAREPRDRKWSLGAFIVVLLLLAFQLIAAPNLSRDWIVNMHGTSMEEVQLDPSSLAILHGFLLPYLHYFGRGVVVLYIAYAVYLVLVARLVIPAALKLRATGDTAGFVMLGLLVNALILPRYKDYMYALDIPAAIYVIVSIWRRSPVLSAACLLAVTTNLFDSQSFWSTWLCLAALIEHLRQPLGSNGESLPC